MPRVHIFSHLGTRFLHNNMAVFGEDAVLLRSTNRDLLSAIFKDSIPGMAKNIVISLIDVKKVSQVFQTNTNFTFSVILK